jgi:hypothetical protein
MTESDILLKKIARDKKILQGLFIAFFICLAIFIAGAVCSSLLLIGKI